jgi:hypothetical protein
LRPDQVGQTTIPAGEGHVMRVIAKTLFAASFIFTVGAANAAEPYGNWVRPSTGTQVNFYACGGKLCGKITGVKDQSRKKEIGTVIMKGAAKSGDNTWKGDLLDVESGKDLFRRGHARKRQRAQPERLHCDGAVPRRDLAQSALILVSFRDAP